MSSVAKDDCETGTCLPEDRAHKEDALKWQTFCPPLKAETLIERQSPSVVIEFCNRCRWLHRATWVQTELFLTFEDKPQQQQEGEQAAQGKYATSTGLKSIQLIPCNAPETGGRFRVWLYRASSSLQQSPHKDNQADQPMTSSESAKVNSQTARALGTFDNGSIVLCWDRKIRAGFPELKELKQIIRDEIAPLQSLGHSDRQHHRDQAA